MDDDNCRGQTDIGRKLCAMVYIVTHFFVSFNGIAGTLSDMEIKGQLSANYVGEHDSAWQNRAVLGYIPDITLKKPLSEDILWDLNLSANINADYVSYPESHTSSSFSLYRLNLQLKTPQSDTRFGLQKINFGPALILRSLRWFDQLSPTDPLKLTEGVKGLRYRYFFMNNANVWLWILYDNNDPKGYERTATKTDAPEFGARLQYPLEMGELGFSVHGRKTESMGFSATSTGQDLIEKRLAFDGKWDLGMGVWYEYVLIDQGVSSQAYNNWFKMLTLGADYTFEIGNGIHFVAEHLISSESDKAMTWRQDNQTTAFQFSYPVGILDAVSLTEIYSWRQKQAFTYLRWDRAYDNWVFSFGVFSAPELVSTNSSVASTGLSGKGLQVVIVFNH